MRVKNTNTTRKRRKKFVKLAKGYRGQRHINFKVAKQQVWKSYLYAYRDRKKVKHDFRKLWISRINAAVRINGVSYSQFMHGLKLANVNLNRKVLSELAISDPHAFSNLVETAKKGISAPTRKAATLETKIKIKNIPKNKNKAKTKNQSATSKKTALAKNKKKIANTKAPSEEKNKQKLAKPNDKSTVKEIKTYLDQNNIKYTSKLKKADLLKLVK